MGSIFFLRFVEQARTEVCCYQLTAEGVRLKTVCLLYCKKGFRTAYIQHMYKCNALQAISNMKKKQTRITPRNHCHY